MERIKRFLNNKKTDENGAIVVEATISLTAFIFAILIILQLVNICYVQSKMAVALNSAEMSQYSYLYTALTLDEYMSGTGGKSSEFMGSFSEVLKTISNGTSNISSDLSSMFSTAGDIAAGDSAAEYIKDGIGIALAKQLIKKNLKSFDGDTADAFLKRSHVVNGFGGLNFLYTSFLTNENQDEIDLVVTYKIQVLKLLNNEFKFNFVQRARCKAWGKGVSIKNPSSAVASGSIWDAGNLSRGSSIINSEKKNYSYTSSSNGFHAYNARNNEFVIIRSINTFDDIYKNSNPPEKEIKNALNSSFNRIYSGVSELGTDVNVVDSSGKDAVVHSNVDTRTYKIVVVAPEDADLSTINSAARAFEAEKASLGYTVNVEVKTGYGNPTPKESKSAETDTGEDN